jgi:excisionase family DNA binding protein
MEDENKALPLSAYVSAEQAAKMLGYRRNHIYRLIRANRLSAEKIGDVYLIPLKELEQFEPNPRGRTRTKKLSWRIYQEAKVIAIDIDVRVFAGKQEALANKLQAILKNDRHIFPGTIARYILKGDEQWSYVHISLVWKSTEMPKEAVLQDYLDAFQAELADVLDWERAEVHTREALLYT